MKITYVDAGAVLSKCGTYRYVLTRAWNLSRRELQRWITWVMLNPSTANGSQDDHTVRKVVGFSVRWGYDALAIVNMFAYRARDPLALLNADRIDIVGPENDRWIAASVLQAQTTVVAWGAHGRRYAPRIASVLAILQEHGVVQPMCLGTTTDNLPLHPLILGYSTPLRPWRADHCRGVA